MGGGSFPRSFLIPGTDTSIRVGGFVDFTTLYFINGGGNVNGSNYGSNAGQNGTLPSLPLTGGFVPGAPGGGFVASQLNAHPSRNNGIWEFSVQQSRLDVETRTPTSWGEARTFFAFDWAGCDNFSCQDLQQGGGDSLHPRLRFAYGTLGGFLAGQALSNFSDADADTESMDFGGAIGSTGGQRIPQVRYTVPGPYGSAFSVSAENPWTAVITPGGLQSSDFAVSGTGTSTTPADGVIGPICNGIPCTGAGTAQANPTTTKAPSRYIRLLLGAALGACRLGRSRSLSDVPRWRVYQPNLQRRLAAISRATCTLIGGDIIRTIFCGALSSATQSASTPAAV